MVCLSYTPNEQDANTDATKRDTVQICVVMQHMPSKRIWNLNAIHYTTRAIMYFLGFCSGSWRVMKSATIPVVLTIVIILPSSITDRAATDSAPGSVAKLVAASQSPSLIAYRYDSSLQCKKVLR